jgi:hypothetical protein
MKVPKWLNKLLPGHSTRLKIASLEARVHNLQVMVRERTEIHADISGNARGQNVIIVVGRYRNRDYVQAYSVSVESLAEMVEILKRWEWQYGHVKTLDAPPAFKACFERDKDRRGIKDGY